jgi:hypothetical protein
VGKKIVNETADPELGAGPSFDLDRELPDLEARERARTGPGSVARRTLEALADHRRLSSELADLEDIDP